MLTSKTKFRGRQGRQGFLASSLHAMYQYFRLGMYLMRQEAQGLADLFSLFYRIWRLVRTDSSWEISLWNVLFLEFDLEFNWKSIDFHLNTPWNFEGAKLWSNRKFINAGCPWEPCGGKNGSLSRLQLDVFTYIKTWKLGRHAVLIGNFKDCYGQPWWTFPIGDVGRA